MLDAIASAPFLATVSPEGETEEHEEPGAAAAEKAAAPTVFERPLETWQSQPETEPSPEEAAGQGAARGQEHEIAATEEEAPAEETASEEPHVEAQPAETRRHPIHGASDEPEPVSDKAPRKMGWWSRRKTG
jgi:hypothetical protein